MFTQEEKMVRHHLDVFLLHFKPQLGTSDIVDTNLPGVYIRPSVCPRRDADILNRIWSIRPAGGYISEDTLSAGAFPAKEVIGYVVSDFPHFGVPIHFRMRNIYRQITDKGAAKSFSRIIRRSRNWIVHNAPNQLVEEYLNDIDRHLDRIRA